MSKNADQSLSRTERAAAIQKKNNTAERRQRNLVVGIVAVFLLSIVVGVGYALMSGRDTSGRNANAVPANVNNNFGAVLGDEETPVTVTIYEDFMCPACGDFEEASKDYLTTLLDNGDINIEYRMISFLDEASSTRYSTRSANAYAVVLDAYGLEKATKYHQSLYTNQPDEGTAGLSDDELIDLAVEVGAVESKIRPGIESEKFKQWVINATDQASKDGVNGTPTVQVNGETLKNPYEELDTAIKAALTD